MIIWVLLAIVAQFLTALIVVIDKYVLVSGGKIGVPVVYAFYVSLLSSFVVVLLPFGVVGWPTVTILFYSLVSSVTFVLAILHLYGALKYGHAADAVPVAGAVSALTAAVFASMYIDTDLPRAFFPAFILMVIGTFLIAHFRFNSLAFMRVLVAGAFFGISAVAIKLVFMETEFINGFFWSRMTNVLVALLLLAVPAHRALIFHGYRGTSGRVKGLVVGNKILGGIAGILSLLAISLGSVSIVQAMSGLQFAFVLAFVFVGAYWFPKTFRGEIHHHHFPHQIYGVICIIAGIAALFLV